MFHLPWTRPFSAQNSAKSPQMRRWGCFESIQLAEEGGFRAWLLRHSVRLRTRWRHMPYGDQALFVRRDLFWCALHECATPLQTQVLKCHHDYDVTQS
jgi:hypothetical protein